MTSDDRNAPQIRRLLPPLQILSLVCLLFASMAVLAPAGPWAGASTTVAVVYAGAVPVVTVLWSLRARASSSRARALATVAVALVLLPVAMLGALGFTIPVLLLAIALVVMDIGRRAGYAAAAVVGAVGTILHLTSGNGAFIGVMNALPAVVLLAFGVALGTALRAYDDAHHRDRLTIAERDAALERLEQAMARLRRSTEVEKELVLADERARSARDLHDGLGHRLTLISMSLEFARRMRDRQPEAAWDEVTTADRTAREALAEMRTWVRALSPVRDTEATGIAAFEAIAESFRGTGLEVVVDAEGEDVTPTEDASLLLYRAVQEGLTNALRHGRARRVGITLTADQHQVVLEMVNDLDAAARKSSREGDLTPGFGLRGLMERAEGLAGSVEVACGAESFVLTLRLPRSTACVEQTDPPPASAPVHRPPAPRQGSAA